MKPYPVTSQFSSCYCLLFFTFGAKAHNPCRQFASPSDAAFFKYVVDMVLDGLFCYEQPVRNFPIGMSENHKPCDLLLPLAQTETCQLRFKAVFNRQQLKKD